MKLSIIKLAWALSLNETIQFVLEFLGLYSSLAHLLHLTSPWNSQLRGSLSSERWVLGRRKRGKNEVCVHVRVTSICSQK